MAGTHQTGRDYSAVERRATAEAAVMGGKFFYRWSLPHNQRGQTAGCGVTVNGASMLLRQWGSAECDAELHGEGLGFWLFEATFVDLTTGLTVSRLYRKSHKGAPGRHTGNRWRSLQLNDGKSRAFRNTICAALPQRLIHQCIEAAVERETFDALHRETAGYLGQRDGTSLRALARAVGSGWVSATDVFARETN
ncbi:MAG: hypothetical protein JRD89_03030 [Deltaproteobacteria bacterium]|nr:hypothetical protein [Deltaproteobacteria bacterium]